MEINSTTENENIWFKRKMEDKDSHKKIQSNKRGLNLQRNKK